MSMVGTKFEAYKKSYSDKRSVSLQSVFKKASRDSADLKEKASLSGIVIKQMIKLISRAAP
jgi:hypothetical protein